MPVSPVLETLDQYRRALDAKDAAAMSRLAKHYGRSLKRLEILLDGLLFEIGDSPPTKGQIVRLQRYTSLIEQVKRELEGLSVITANEIEIAVTEAAPMGAQAAIDVLSATVGGDAATIGAQFHALPREAIEALVGMLDPSGPLYSRLSLLAPYVTDLVADAMIEGITLGYNPRRIAAMLQQAFGNGLTDALRFVRTAQLWAYRGATHATYRENSDIVTGWVWNAFLGGRTCMSCIALHGTIHPMDEILNDHHSGRCSMIPLVRGYPNPVEETGFDWFSRQPESVQRKMMGREFYDAWKGGAFDLSDIPGEYHNEVYGPMRRTRPLWELLGAEPPLRM